jgi:hypothetical protein
MGGMIEWPCFTTDCGGAFYTLTDAAITEVDPGGQIVWQYVGEMACPHSAERLADGTTLISDTGWVVPGRDESGGAGHLPPG